MIGPGDEALHPIGSEPHWQESYYFNWFDPGGDHFGLARIGYRFADRRIDGLVVAFSGGELRFIYPAVGLRQPRTLGPGDNLRARGLGFAMEQPLSRWRLSLAGRNSMELEWQSFTPPFDYRGAERAMPENLAANHFEQSGRVTGWTCFRGDRVEIDGTGQRDKSWGARDWARVEGWDWISAQFDDQLSFNLWRASLASRQFINGYVFRDGENHAIAELEIRYRCDRPEVPVTAEIHIVDAGGVELSVSARAVGQGGMVKRGLFIQETPARFHLVGSDRRSGVGVIEHTWRPRPTQLLQRLPELAVTGLRVMRL